MRSIDSFRTAAQKAANKDVKGVPGLDTPLRAPRADAEETDERIHKPDGARVPSNDLKKYGLKQLEGRLAALRRTEAVEWDHTALARCRREIQNTQRAIDWKKRNTTKEQLPRAAE